MVIPMLMNFLSFFETFVVLVSRILFIKIRVEEAMAFTLFLEQICVPVNHIKTITQEK